MTGFLLDENLPRSLRFTPSLPVRHVRDLGISVTDTFIWEYATHHDWVIITKDTDFSARILLTSPPPRVIHLRFGNMRLQTFHKHMATVWPRVESLIQTHKLVNIYTDSITAVS